ncbi:MAG: excinuclease ABC subunit UvrC [Nitrospirae bacterium]|nr:excinuclease ABC subunit UvrC [Nitrospirota bacterium]
MLAEPGDKLAVLPDRPGVYIFKDRKHRVLYVGKAKSLRSRVRSYFQEAPDLGLRKRKMVSETADFDYLVTDSELEAFVLEANLIKRHKPPYNVVLRDDKNYPYLRLSMRDEWPALDVARRIRRDGSVYFGPYVPAGVMWETLAFVRRTFPVRTCKYRLDRPMRPCVEFQMGRCAGPCGGKIERENYMRIVEDVRLFLLGKSRELLDGLRERMKNAAEELDFERAAGFRDRIAKIEKAWESQRVISPNLGDIDVFAIYRDEASASVQALFVRAGVLSGGVDFQVMASGDNSDAEILASVIAQYFSKDIQPPSELLIPVEIPDGELLASWLSERAGNSVRITASPKSGKRADLLSMAAENAMQAFKRRQAKRVDTTLATLKELLGLKKLPEHIHAFDISTLSGTESVGARVSWKDGRFMKDEYRRYHIRTVEGMDDFAMMREVVGRSYGEEPLPDLIVIDGGRGQLDAAMQALTELNLAGAEAVGLAKIRRNTPMERVFVPDAGRGIRLNPQDPATHLMQKIRDETHRFAVTFHRAARDSRVISSPLDAISGVGKARRIKLLKAFGSISAIRAASENEIAAVPGIDRKTAANVKAALCSDVPD